MHQPAQCTPLPTRSTRQAETIRQLMAAVNVAASGSEHRPLPALDWPRRLFADTAADRKP